MPHLHLITTGMIGEAELLEQQRLAGRQIHTLSALITAAQEDEFENATLDILADAPWTLHLDMPFSAEELRTTPLTESTAHRLALDTIAAFLDRAKHHIKEGAHDGVALGREYGFTLVPMQAAYREEIRRMAELTAFVTRHADAYTIYFAGGAHLPIKTPSAEGAE